MGLCETTAGCDLLCCAEQKHYVTYEVSEALLHYGQRFFFFWRTESVQYLNHIKSQPAVGSETVVKPQ